MHVYPYQAETFLREARDAFKRMAEAKNGDELKRALISFVNAARFSTQALETDYKNKLEGFNEWWEDKGEFLGEDAIAGFFRNMRNRITKEGEMEKILNISWEIRGPMVMQGPLQISPDGTILVPDEEKRGWTPKKDIKGQKITKWDFFNKPAGYQHCGAQELCERYLKLLESIFHEFTEKFGRLR